MSNAVTDWRPARAIPLLADNALHIWLALADEHGPSLPRYTQYLSPDELQRAGRLRLPKLQERFIISRGLLRALLGRYLDCRPELIQFAFSLQGKPYLPASVSSGQLQFNLSHSRDAIVLALRLKEPVGVDVEYMRDSLDFVSLARRFFSEQEHRDISSIAGLEQKKAFYAHWTRKEAYLKATGQGLSGLQETASLESGIPSNWSIIDLIIPAPSYAGAVAFAGKSSQIEALLLTADGSGI
jgi:4'-phosphopantetheinyl transferase